uniref:AlNc14C119G6627 protein n=1 Tax=Albugo laibachii Nc14 TaxID=890382 RepID=F0WJ96_9STRA|nr:AlNc14C119G6627 [Albugo laibachii Nc14]CCA26614.1 AlNc14C395G11318 [Albugo laibachii Nc14]|eukprot:CCA26614.1 AlNc14C395G11318 [Albugo laibachii Nc14]
MRMKKLFQSRCKFPFVMIMTHLLAQWTTLSQIVACVHDTRELQVATSKPRPIAKWDGFGPSQLDPVIEHVDEDTGGYMQTRGRSDLLDHSGSMMTLKSKKGDDTFISKENDNTFTTKKDDQTRTSTSPVKPPKKKSFSKRLSQKSKSWVKGALNWFRGSSNRKAAEPLQGIRTGSPPGGDVRDTTDLSSSHESKARLIRSANGRRRGDLANVADIAPQA